MDFIIGDHTAVEVKAKENVSPQEFKSLRALREEKQLKNSVCVAPPRNAAETNTILNLLKLEVS